MLLLSPHVTSGCVCVAICSDCFLGLTNSPSVWALGTMCVGLSLGDCPLLSVEMPFVTTPSAVHSHLFLCTCLCVHLNCTHLCRHVSFAMTVVTHLDLRIPALSLDVYTFLRERTSLGVYVCLECKCHSCGCV